MFTDEQSRTLNLINEPIIYRKKRELAMCNVGFSFSSISFLMIKWNEFD